MAMLIAMAMVMDMMKELIFSTPRILIKGDHLMNLPFISLHTRLHINFLQKITSREEK
jgi:hypothetical protein